MKHRELTDHIKGSFLKRQYLEAFLVQSAYIESLVKLYVDYQLFTATSSKLDEHGLMLDATRKQFEKLSLNELTKFLLKSGLITKEQENLLDKYRIRRNKMLHDLIQEIKQENFDIELKTIIETGNTLIESEKFAEMAELIDFMEHPDESESVANDKSEASVS